MQKKFFAVALIAMGSLVFSSCGKDEEAPAAPKTLYARLGGAPAITLVVDKFIGNVAANPKMVRTFQPLLEEVKAGKMTRVTSLRNNLIDQIGQASGGPEKYKGKDMVAAHKGMKITDDEFNSLVGNLVSALNEYKVPSTEQGELLSVLGGLKGSIVNQ